MYYLNNFLIYSLFGHLLESTLYLILGNNNSSGFLYGPWTPVYGCGIVLIIIINNYLDKKKIKGIKKGILTFFLNSFILTIIEFIGGYLLKFIFNKSYWNYSNFPLHIGKYISIEMALLWGLLSLIYLYLLKKISDKIIKKIPNYLTITCLVFFLIDCLVTLINKINIR